MPIDLNDKEKLRNTLTDLLKTNVMQLEFVKVDGSTRNMIATLIDEKIVKYERKTEAVKEVNESVLAVFDLQKKEWRSFRLDSLTSARIYTESKY